MTYPEVLANAREVLSKNCKACPVCNGKACSNHIPGPGAKGVGDTAMRNYDKWQEVRVNMDTICEYGTPDTSLELFGKTFRYPFFAGPVGAVTMHYSDKYDDMAYNNILVKACADNGIAAFTGDGMNPEVMKVACQAIAASDGVGIPTEALEPRNRRRKNGPCQGVRLLCHCHGHRRRRSAVPEGHESSRRQQDCGTAV